MILASFDKQLLTFSIQNKPKILWAFRVWYALILGITLYVGTLAANKNLSYLDFLPLGVIAGQLSLIFFILTMLPSMMRRLGVAVPTMNTLMLFRRQVGISMFLLAFAHYIILRWTIVLSGGMLALPPALFETMGALAFYLSAPLFLTSNDFSVKKMGKWWKRLHRLSYVIVWFIFLHTAMQSSVWMVLIGVTALLQTVSLIKDGMKKRATTATSVQASVSSGTKLE